MGRRHSLIGFGTSSKGPLSLGPSFAFGVRKSAVVLPPVAGYSLWLRADLGISLATGVSAWADQSGNGNSVVQASGPNQPTYTATLNGHKVLSFSGSQYLTMASRLAFVGKNMTVFCVMRTSSAATTSTAAADPPITAVGDSTGGTFNEFGVGSGKALYRVFDIAWETVSGATAVNGGTGQVIGYTQALGGAIALYVNGASDATGTFVPGGAGPGIDSVGRGLNAADSWVGDIGEVLVYGSVLTGPQIASLATYFRSFWGTP